jgi:lipopolysaccharide export system permease protein
MKLLDRYILKQFFLSTLVALAGFVIIYIAIDMMEKLDKFLDKKVPAMVIVEYYVNFIPQILSLILPVGLMLGSLFSAGKMSTSNEVVASRSAGMSLYRFMLPYVGVALLVSLGAVYFNGWILPRANARVLAIQRQHVGENLLTSAQFNLHLQESRNTIITMQDFSLINKRATRVSIQYFDPKQPKLLIRRIDAKTMAWDSARSSWQLLEAKQRVFAGGGERISTLQGDSALMKFNFTPDELRERTLSQNELTNPELWARIQLAKRSGQDTSRDEVDYHAKYAMAFTSLIVVLFGVPFASRKKRGGLGPEFATAIFISFLFLAFTKVSQTFGYSGQIDPMLTAWLANILFFIGAMGVLVKAQK